MLTAIIRGEAWTASSLRNPILRKNYRRLNRTFCRSNPVTEDLCEPCLRLLPIVGSRSDLLSAGHRLGRHLIPALLRVAAYADRWIRSPEDWIPKEGDQWSDLLRHLFVRWELPAFFESAWLEKGDLRYLERDWYCDIAAGKNWRKLEKIPASVTGRSVHFAMTAPDELTVREALRWGQLTAMGASPALIDEVLKSCVVNTISNDEVWSCLLAKVVGSKNFESRNFGMMADFFGGLYQWNQFFRARDLVRLPLSELLNHCRKHWRRLLDNALADGLKFKTDDLGDAGLRRDLQRYTHAWWEPMECVPIEEIQHRARNGKKTVWQVTQLVRHSQLVAEAVAMNHCVDSFRRSCQRKFSAIFSVGEMVDQDGCQQVERRVTVEVYRKKRWVIQAKRRWNDEPERVELEVISQWARANAILVRP